jgi:ABC-2 type transport system ATP-binding protein
MIEVVELTKRYAGHRAVNGLTFTVAPGEIVGLLGPNGAGKTTIMRILSCYMPATSGSARVAGFDVFTQADEVRRHIGYMPENNPLHREMRVRDYLKFRARLKGLSRGRSRDRVDTVLQQCGLADVSKRVIGQLSKGYQQRVGLADALVHEPSLIILDEPTAGLDPNQIRSVRQLIKDLAGKHTVLLSTHILPEVEMTCSRVLMNADGRVVAEIAAPANELRDVFENASEIDSFDISPADGDYVRCTLTARAGLDVRPQVFRLVCERNWKLRELSRSAHSLEDIFVRVTRPEEEN